MLHSWPLRQTIFNSQMIPLTELIEVGLSCGECVYILWTDHTSLLTKVVVDCILFHLLSG